MYKHVIIVRADLHIGKGKLAAQVSHASVTAYERVRMEYPKLAAEWNKLGMKKIVLRVQNEKELIDYYKHGKEAGIPCELIHDAGHTQVEPGTVTCLGAGPWEEKKLDEIFGKLKLL